MNRIDQILSIADAVEGGRCWRCDRRDPAGGLGLCDPCLAWLRDPDHLHAPTYFERLTVPDGPSFPAIAVLPSPEAVLQAPLADAFAPLVEVVSDALRRIAEIVADVLATIETATIPPPRPAPKRFPPLNIPPLNIPPPPPVHVPRLPVRPWQGRR